MFIRYTALALAIAVLGAPPAWAQNAQKNAITSGSSIDLTS